jgi:hypothetical protein
VEIMNKPRQDESGRESLAGPVERVTFHNPETGFCVLRIKTRGHRDLITLVGSARQSNRANTSTQVAGGTITEKLAAYIYPEKYDHYIGFILGR